MPQAAMQSIGEVKMQETPGRRATAVQPKCNAPIAVASIEALSKVFWPMIACLALVMFEKPISTALDAAARSGASVEIAGLKITLSKSAIPSPPERVKNVLPQLEPEDIDFIIATTGGDNTLNICHQDAELEAFKENSVFSRLKKLEMITFEKAQVPSPNGKPCLAGSKTQFEPLYNLVRSYLIDVLKAVTFNY